MAATELGFPPSHSFIGCYKSTNFRGTEPQDGLMKPVKILATRCLLLSALGATGCSSVMSHTGADQGYYPGTRANVNMMKNDDTSWGMMPLLAIDLPFSAVMDTVLLPYDYLRSDKDKTVDSPKARIQHDEEQNLAASGNPGQGMPTPPAQ
jgi:uncharacterized protein YceK